MQKGPNATEVFKLLVESAKKDFKPGKLVSFSKARVDFSAPRIKRIADALPDDETALGEMIKRVNSVLQTPKNCFTALGCDSKGKNFAELVGENDSFHPERNPLDALLEYRPLEKVGFMLRLSRGERGHYIGLIDGKRKIAVYAFYRGDSPPWALGMDNDSLNASDSLEAGNRLAALKALHEIALLLEKPIGLALKHASEGAMARVCGLGSVTVEREGKVERVLLTPEEFFDIKADFCTHVGVVGKMNALRRVGYLLGEAYLKGYPGLNLDELVYDEKNGFVRDGAPWGERALVEDLAGELNPIRQSFLTFAQAIYIGEDEKRALLEGWREALASSPHQPDELFEKAFPRLEYKTEKVEGLNGLFG